MVGIRLLSRIKNRILNNVPADYARSLLLNILGLQLYRTAGFALLHRLRPSKRISPQYEELVSTLQRDGVLILREFFPAETFARLSDEYRRLTPQFTANESRVVLPHVASMSIHDERVSSPFRECFTRNELIRSVSGAFLKQDYHLPMNARLTHISCSRDELAKPMYGGTNNLHFDAPARVLKAFYYLGDTTENNAALRYCFGTNKRDSLRRLLFEYKLSIRYMTNRWNPNHGGEYLDGKPWIKVTEHESRQHGLQETPVVVPANTLVFVDTGGFHRRGQFLKEGVRETVEINYRNADSLNNRLFPLRKWWKNT